MLFLFWDCFEPFYGVVSAFPQVHFSCLNDFFVYAVEDVFATGTTKHPFDTHTDEMRQSFPNMFGT